MVHTRISKQQKKLIVLISIVSETQISSIISSIVVDCSHNFGQVVANRIGEILHQNTISTNIACAISLYSHNIGHLDSYMQRLAEKEMIGFNAVKSHKASHWVSYLWCQRSWRGKERQIIHESHHRNGQFNRATVFGSSRAIPPRSAAGKAEGI